MAAFMFGRDIGCAICAHHSLGRRREPPARRSLYGRIREAPCAPTPAARAHVACYKYRRGAPPPSARAGSGGAARVQQGEFITHGRCGILMACFCGQIQPPGPFHCWHRPGMTLDDGVLL